MKRLLAATLFSAAALIAPSNAAGTETAVFAGGCFWCVETDFDSVKGVISTTSGYAGGTMANPTYENHEGNVEAVRIEFDPAQVSYDQLVSAFLRSVDPTDDGGQFCDRGPAYKTAIFTFSDAQKASAAAAVKQAETDLGKKVVTPVKDFTTFGEAEDYHQDYHHKNPVKYKYYRFSCGRDAAVKDLWGDMARKGLGS
ncbi:MAG: peptide-methionine (S)-S-oxide reductase MsrA [Rhizobiaceae bacterium]